MGGFHCSTSETTISAKARATAGSPSSSVSKATNASLPRQLATILSSKCSDPSLRRVGFSFRSWVYIMGGALFPFVELTALPHRTSEFDNRSEKEREGVVVARRDQLFCPKLENRRHLKATAVARGTWRRQTGVDGRCTMKAKRLMASRPPRADNVRCMVCCGQDKGVTVPRLLDAMTSAISVSRRLRL